MPVLAPPKFASRLRGIGTEGAFEVLARARALEAQGRSVIHLEIGEPDFPTPANITEAGIRALHAGETHYTPAPGILELRQAIAEYVSRTRGVAVNPAQVIVGPGAKPVLYWTLLSLLEPGDEVVYPDPSYPLYESIAAFIGARPVGVRLREEDGFAITPEAVERALTPRTRMIILNSPHNPTGGMLPRASVRAIAELAAARGLWVLSDEIYSRIHYGAGHHSIYAEPGIADHCILLDGYSKTYAMTGWRLGYGVMPLGLAEAEQRLIINTVSCTATFTQWAGIEALRGDQQAVDAMVAEFRRRRDHCHAELNRMPGITCRLPEGAFYLFPNISRTGFSSRELQEKLLDEAGVALLSGTAFGAGGEGYLRISIANSLENLSEGLRRIRRWIEQHPAR